MKTRLDKLISEFAKKHELGSPEREPDGAFEWCIDGKDIKMFESTGKIYVEAPLYDLPEDKSKRVECIRLALQSALVNVDKNPESLFIDAGTDKLCLYSSQSSNEMSLFEFEAQLESFMNTLDCMSEVTQTTEAPRGMRP